MGMAFVLFLLPNNHLSQHNKINLIVLRHSERQDYAGNPDTKWPCDPNITNMGYEMAKRIKYFNGTLTRIMTSPFLRCRETARALNENLHLPIYVDEMLFEHLVDPKVCRIRYHKLEFMGDHKLDDLKIRCSFLYWNIRKYENSMIVTHASIVKCLSELFLKKPLTGRYNVNYLEGFQIIEGNYRTIKSPFKKLI